MVKPWPIKLVDRRVHGGFGIMLDDLLAGLAALACVQTLIYFALI
ncbi:phosphatidylglycerophosphatase A [Alteromonadaceae bacterium 2753L.S.0a.02]|nr:phosphatidylglycerophosphatase A [Alteromonadaceae bacterium 2753L.S.0a.02]